MVPMAYAVGGHVSFAEVKSENAHQGMVPTEGQGELTFFGVLPDHISNGLTNTRHRAGVLELADGRVIFRSNLLKLVVAVELNLPSQG